MMNRLSEKLDSVTVALAVADSAEIRYSEFSSGMVHVPNGSGITELTWYSAPEAGGTYEPAYDYDAVAVTQTVAQDQAHPIPLALIGARAIKAIASAGTAGTVNVSLKA